MSVKELSPASRSLGCLMSSPFLNLAVPARPTRTPNKRLRDAPPSMRRANGDGGTRTRVTGPPYEWYGIALPVIPGDYRQFLGTGFKSWFVFQLADTFMPTPPIASQHLSCPGKGHMFAPYQTVPFSRVSSCFFILSPKDNINRGAGL